VHYALTAVAGKCHCLGIAHVADHDLARKIGESRGRGEIEDTHVRPPLGERAHRPGADEPAATGYEHTCSGKVPYGRSITGEGRKFRLPAERPRDYSGRSSRFWATIVIPAGSMLSRSTSSPASSHHLRTSPDSGAARLSGRPSHSPRTAFRAARRSRPRPGVRRRVPGTAGRGWRWAGAYAGERRGI
jgi:hypothetical protein